ncbi:histone-binding protein N1/N2-like [Synchiropus splendidus]|uniref:histone-binding protein N1/N2-like n=1 Tax=Synchiropus splendidus TaxID=270530 RepID=UPI00237EABDD|nr:histone-binding protein N1/N2-like [Synchiropus splendidus]
MEEANKLIGAGKKHLVMGKAVEAVSVLQEACGLLAKEYGDTADECAEAFFWCGKALLELARMENSVLGNALEGVPEEEDEEKPKDSNIESAESVDEKTRDELREQVYDAMAEKKSEEEKQGGDGGKEVETEDGKEVEKEEQMKEDAKVKEGEKGGQMKEDAKVKEGEKEEQMKEDEEKEGESDANKAEGKDAAEKAEEEKMGDEENEKEDGDEEMEAEEDDAEKESGDEEGGGDDDEEEEEEVGNLQLAWEMLELAKVIYRRKESKEDQLMAAQAHLKLGEVSAETGNYSQALDDFQECLNLQLKHLDSDSRLLAATRYQLGLTLSLNLQYDRAVEELNNSIAIIKRRLDNLTGLIDKATDPESLQPERQEMEELKALLPEIQEKVEDAKEDMKTMNGCTDADKNKMDGPSSSSAFPGTSGQSDASSSTSNGSSSTKTSVAPASDISHLVRKKRKPEESPVKEGVKKVKHDETNGVEHTNGHVSNGHATNGHANGHAAEVESK